MDIQGVKSLPKYWLGGYWSEMGSWEIKTPKEQRGHYIKISKFLKHMNGKGLEL